MEILRPTNELLAPYITFLTVGLRHTLKLILLLNGIRVRRTLSCVYQLVSQALGNCLDVPESSLTSLNERSEMSYVSVEDQQLHSREIKVTHDRYVRQW